MRLSSWRENLEGFGGLGQVPGWRLIGLDWVFGFGYLLRCLIWLGKRGEGECVSLICALRHHDYCIKRRLLWGSWNDALGGLRSNVVSTSRVDSRVLRCREKPLEVNFKLCYSVGCIS